MLRRLVRRTAPALAALATAAALVGLPAGPAHAAPIARAAPHCIPAAARQLPGSAFLRAAQRPADWICILRYCDADYCYYDCYEVDPGAQADTSQPPAGTLTQPNTGDNPPQLNPS
ncbi:hypothetical protein C7C46_17985 [Streptomyces tateyamensis]|uniref:Secreted protein n=1 Tax=Streptomyces tateyamensis TaxID=565073 RepID=A0A2V4NP24_9ACTN|nr:hypothetical protein [Streptomyces tateyamensis]PYC77743.1 hypothetical protein C7C46_17985 [Streptomyces tateyamensis]